MKLLLRRQPSAADWTHGDLYYMTDVVLNPPNGNWICHTLEDEQRIVKIPGETCITTGVYDIKLRTEGGMTRRYAERFGDMHKGMLWLQDVPDFEYVYIHTGNTDDHTEGCILVGMGRQEDRITRSVEAYKQLYPVLADAILNGNGVVIQIQDG